MKRWNELTLQEKQDYIQACVAKGIKSLNDIEDRYNLYLEYLNTHPQDDIYPATLEAIEKSRNTKYNPSIDDLVSDMQAYEEYAQKLANYKAAIFSKDNPENFAEMRDKLYNEMMNPREADYNYMRWYNMTSPEELFEALHNEDGHWADSFGKTVNYPTANVESPYSGYVNPYNPEGIEFGLWSTTPKGTSVYTPSLDLIIYTDTDRILDAIGWSNDEVMKRKFFNNVDNEKVLLGTNLLPTQYVTPDSTYTNMRPNDSHTGYVYKEEGGKLYSNGGKVLTPLLNSELLYLEVMNNTSNHDLMPTADVEQNEYIEPELSKEQLEVIRLELNNLKQEKEANTFQDGSLLNPENVKYIKELDNIDVTPAPWLIDMLNMNKHFPGFVKEWAKDLNEFNESRVSKEEDYNVPYLTNEGLKRLYSLYEAANKPDIVKAKVGDPNVVLREDGSVRPVYYSDLNTMYLNEASDFIDEVSHPLQTKYDKGSINLENLSDEEYEELLDELGLRVTRLGYAPTKDDWYEDTYLFPDYPEGATHGYILDALMPYVYSGNYLTKYSFNPEEDEKITDKLFDEYQKKHPEVKYYSDTPYSTNIPNLDVEFDSIMNGLYGLKEARNKKMTTAGSVMYKTKDGKEEQHMGGKYYGK